MTAMMPRYGKGKPWILQGPGFYTNIKVSDMVQQDKLPLLKSPWLS